MEIASILKWLEASGLATRIRESLFLFPLLESIHVIGLALVFGTILILDLRLLGLASAQRSFQRIASDILKWTWAAFALTALTGALMFITNAGVYYNNFYFRIKMLMLVLSGVNMFVFELTAGRSRKQWDQAPSAPGVGRVVGAISIALWIGVIIVGRLIGFTTSRVANVGSPPAEINFEDLLQGAPPEAPPEAK